MNYLETGLSHTEFFPKKTQFNPPRFIPLCSLGRKYMGLEPLTKREIRQLSNRLSEPKRPVGREDSPAIKEFRPKSTGTGRFVGEKKMDSFQIEKMVSRLYSRRKTKDYAFVDETVEANDIINMTNREEDSADDSEEEMNNVRTSHPKKQGQTVTYERTPEMDVSTKRENVGSKNVNRSENHKGYECGQKQKNEPKARGSVVVSNRVSVKNSGNAEDSVSLRRLNSESSFNRPTSTSGYSYTSKVEIVKCQKNAKKDYQRSKSESSIRPPTSTNTRQAGMYAKSTDHIEDATRLETPKPEAITHRTTSMISLNTEYSFADDNLSMTSQPISPRRKFSKMEDNKVPRLSLAQCDELLIDRVATYNRSPRVRVN